ncbi:MAG: right-handed parallel beta-helix repeat-containing protein [Gammaproteobacteria bacterium]
MTAPYNKTRWNPCCRLLVAAVMAAFVPTSAAATAYYVATDGDDANPGTILSPWRTIQKAANSAVAGSVVYVRGGVYHERITVRVSGSATQGYTVLRNYPGEKAIVDGTGLSVPDTPNGLFLLANRRYVEIRGFELRNYKTATLGRVPAAIYIHGASQHIRIRNNKIHHIEHNGKVAHDVDAHGIAVYGDNAAASIHHLLIRGNELHALKLGSSESLVVNGNVNGFQIVANTIHDNNNIGIDAIGFERVSADPATDQARNGLIAQNRVYNIDSSKNPAYGGERSAGGIYVDGGRNIVIERNRVYRNNIGIELASEHKGKSTRSVIVRNNFVYLNDIVGITIGGYDRQRGSTVNCRIVNNTLLRNDRLQDGNGELMLQFDTRNNVIKNNIFQANSQNLLISNPFTENNGNVVDYNIYFIPGGNPANGEWQWKKQWYSGFNAYRAATGNDAHSSFVDPLLVSNTAPFNLHLQALSPAIDSGVTLKAAGQLDIDGQARVQGLTIDIGADELF